MPRRTDIESILIIGSGPIVIGQACEFDYSGTQACKALVDDGYRVTLVNSNPATIMTDPGLAHRTYIEPINVEAVSRIIRIEKPQAILPTLGGQTGLNVATQLVESGIVDEFGIELLGATYEAIKKAEDREGFKAAMERCGLDLPRSGIARSPEDAFRVVEEIGLPCVIRPSYTLGGTGSGIARTREEFAAMVESGLDLSLITEVLIEESVEGWKEFELEVMRDCRDNCVVVCSIENLDPMGVHTGDSITVAPAQTLTDKEYQRMRNAAFAVIREVGVATGGSNIQFAIEPDTGRMVVIEMNPRVSRSSALASKATGFPIAKIATKLAVGYTLDEIPNDITRKTPACFEPSIDYCVVKAPKFDFAKFPEADGRLTTKMKSVGEVMAIGRTFKEALQKALRSLEIRSYGLGLDALDRLLDGDSVPDEALREKLRTPNAERLFYLRHAFRRGWSVEDIHRATGIDPWFLDNVLDLVEFEEELRRPGSMDSVPVPLLREAKRRGYSDVQLATVWGTTEPAVRARRLDGGIRATFKLVDTCAAEFEAYTPYYYSTYESEDETRPADRRKIMILGGGPNRIGQGIEFDYCCCHAAFALKEEGIETIMVNSNPETVSTDYDTSDKLYFEPLTLENVLNIYDREQLRPDRDGVILQLGGQTPLNLAKGLAEAGVPIVGTSPRSIELAEDRKRFKGLLDSLGLFQPDSDGATSVEEAVRVAERIGYPVLVRPSFVLGGRAMDIVWNREELVRCAGVAFETSPEYPVLIDKFLEDAIELDVDAIADGERVVIGGIMEHIEHAGIHSGDSSCAIPPYSLGPSVLDEIRRITYLLGEALDVRGLMNIQYAVKDGWVYILEVNPRASRTVPFVSKAIGVPLAKLAAKVMVGRTLADLGFTSEVHVTHFSVKRSVFPFNRFPECDVILGPEMKSTGEVMGIDDNFGTAYAKAHMAAYLDLPLGGKVFLSVKDSDKKYMPPIARQLRLMGFELLATEGTKRALEAAGIDGVARALKIQDGRPNVADVIRGGGIKLIINTPKGHGPRLDDAYLRSLAIALNVPCITTISAARAAVFGIQALKKREWGVRAVQDYFPRRGVEG